MQTKSNGHQAPLDAMTLARFRDAIGDLTPIVQTVLQKLPTRCNSLRGAFDAGNSLQVDTLSHFIAGSVANLGAAKLTRLARDLEYIAKDVNLDSASEPLKQLEQKAERVTSAPTALLVTERHGSSQVRSTGVHDGSAL